jgi:hypothetical protein
MNSTNTDKYWKWLIVALVVFNLISLCQYLPNIQDGHDSDTTRIKPEQTRQHIQNTDSLHAEIFAQVAKEHQKQIEALYSTLATAEWKRKQAEQKARESALQYAKTNTLPDCDKALKDCQYENETKGFSLAVQERMIAEQDSFISVQAFEINRINAVKDSLNTGWAAANKEVALYKGKVQRRNKLLKISGGVIAVLAGVIAIK